MEGQATVAPRRREGQAGGEDGSGCFLCSCPLLEASDRHGAGEEPESGMGCEEEERVEKGMEMLSCIEFGFLNDIFGQ